MIVGIGASAGGLHAFKSFLGGMPADSGMAFVLVQHLSPDHPSMLSDLLARATAMPVLEADDGMPVEPNRVFVIPPDSTLTLKDRCLQSRGRRRRANGAGRSTPSFLRWPPTRARTGSASCWPAPAATARSASRQ